MRNSLSPSRLLMLVTCLALGFSAPRQAQAFGSEAQARGGREFAWANRTAAAETQIELKRTAVLTNGQILLSRIATVTGDKPAVTDRVLAISLGATPWPGNARTVTRENVAMHLRRAGVNLSGVRWSGAETCTVTVRSTKISAKEIMEVGRQYLASLPMLRDGDVRIEAERMPSPKLVAVDNEPIRLTASAASADRPWGRMRVYVKVQAGDRLIATIPVMFLVTATRKVVFATRPLSRSELIEPRHLETSEIVLGPGSGPELYLENEKEAVGKKTARAVAAGTPLTTSMIVEPYATRKGESVSIRLHSRHIEVVTSGVAQRDAYVGEVIPVTVNFSGRKLSCKVTAAGTVELSL